MRDYSWIGYKAAKASLVVVLLLGVVLALSACGGGAATAPDIEATVQSLVETAQPSPALPPTPDIAATVQAAVAEALSTPVATPTPEIEATVVARIEATTQAGQTPTSVPTMPTATRG